MTQSSIRAILVVTAVLVAGATTATQRDTSKPIPVKALKPKLVRFRGEVLHANSVQITVRSQENERVIQTFTYAPKVRDQMQQIIDRGGYQYGDKVEIEHQAGSSVALRVKGKPSKPL
jgi:hypothetical protein